eukprot:178888_1
MEPKSEKRCPLKGKCEDVKIGKCKFSHPVCRWGINCGQLTKRQCTYSHPECHFTYKSNFEPPIIQKLHTKPENANKKWTEKDDSILLQYMNNNPNTYLKDQFLNKMAKTLGRTSCAIKVRCRHIQNAKENKQKSNDISNGNDTDDSTLSSEFQYENKKDKARKNEIYLLFNKLIIYNKMDKNNFSANNLQQKLTQFEKLNWDGNQKQMDKIMLNTPLFHFKNQLIEMEKKYGVIDINKNQKIISQLKLTHKSLKTLVSDINIIINNLEKDNNYVVYEKGFAELTGYDLNYFENVLKAINESKITNEKIKIEGNGNDYDKCDTNDNKQPIQKEVLQQHIQRSCEDRGRDRNRSRNSKKRHLRGRNRSRSRNRDRDRYYRNSDKCYNNIYDRRHGLPQPIPPPIPYMQRIHGPPPPYAPPRPDMQ